MCSSDLLFIDLILPTSLAKEAKQAISILFIYFGLVPPAGIIAVLGIFFSLTVAINFAAFVMVLISLLFFAISPLILDNGRK